MSEYLDLGINNLYLVGINYKTAPLKIREDFVFDKAILQEKAKDIKEAFGINEIMILSTCNRTEIFAISKHDLSTQLIEYLSRYAKHPVEQTKQYIYVKYEQDAIVHIFNLACGLDSQIIGETQILSQLKDAYRTTVVYDLSGAILNRIMRKAFTIAKIVRSQTDIQKGHLSIANLAATLANETFNLDQKKTLIIGSGDMARLSAKYFYVKKANIVYIANRNVSNVDFAQEYNAKIIDLNQINDILCDIDVVVSCIFTPNPIITTVKNNRPILLIDLSVPSSIDNSIKENKNVKLLNIDDLKLAKMESEIAKESSIELSQKLINEQFDIFIRENEALDYSKTIDMLREYADRIRKIEVSRFKKKYKIDDRLNEAIENLTRAILNKTLHEPTSKIRQFIKEPEGDMYIELLKRLFNVSIDKKRANCFFSENPENENN